MDHLLGIASVLIVSRSIHLACTVVVPFPGVLQSPIPLEGHWVFFQDSHRFFSSNASMRTSADVTGELCRAGGFVLQHCVMLVSRDVQMQRFHAAGKFIRW